MVSSNITLGETEIALRQVTEIYMQLENNYPAVMRDAYEDPLLSREVRVTIQRQQHTSKYIYVSI